LITVARFSELALLLPNTDIQLVLFGKPGHDLVHWARKEYPGCIATNDIVWQYTAPRKSGGGSIKIRIHSKDEIWNRNVAQSGPLPDVMVGLNAGIMAYQTWAEVVFISTLFVAPGLSFRFCLLTFSFTLQFRHSFRCDRIR
jgi:hypothetical protein